MNWSEMLLSDLKECPKIGTKVYNHQKTQIGTIIARTNKLRHNGMIYIAWPSGKISSWWLWGLNLEIICWAGRAEDFPNHIGITL
jgi:hypothetical protein